MRAAALAEQKRFDALQKAQKRLAQLKLVRGERRGRPGKAEKCYTEWTALQKQITELSRGRLSTVDDKKNARDTVAVAKAAFNSAERHQSAKPVSSGVGAASRKDALVDSYWGAVEDEDSDDDDEFLLDDDDSDGLDPAVRAEHRAESDPTERTNPERPVPPPWPTERADSVPLQPPALSSSAASVAPQPVSSLAATSAGAAAAAAATGAAGAETDDDRRIDPVRNTMGSWSNSSRLESR